MPFQNNGWSKIRSELLMNISATLADLTRNLDLSRRIPGYLCRALELDPVTLAIVAENASGQEVVMSACSHSECERDSKNDLLSIYEQTRPLSADSGPMLRPIIKLDTANAADKASAAPADSAYPRAIVFSQAIGEGHRMLLVVHQPASAANLSEGMTEVLQLVATHLAKLLGCLVVWSAKPQGLGAPFSRLTDREWNVLRGLESDAGEKQLADRLGLSPHTLHSHIKSIYRKVGVQGRLPLLMLAESSLRDLRTERLNGRVGSRVSSVVAEASVAVG
jgi:DNA-binding CsgD family transcriptional regulator